MTLSCSPSPNSLLFAPSFQIPEEEFKKRRDLRSVRIFTIDPVGPSFASAG